MPRTSPEFAEAIRLLAHAEEMAAAYRRLLAGPRAGYFERAAVEAALKGWLTRHRCAVRLADGTTLSLSTDGADLVLLPPPGELCNLHRLRNALVTLGVHDAADRRRFAAGEAGR